MKALYIVGISLVDQAANAYKPTKIVSVCEDACLPVKPDLQIACRDISDPAGSGAPSEQNVLDLIAFSKTLTPEDIVLVHCHAGISRSTAAGLIFLMHKHNGNVEEAVNELVRVRPIAAPNALMIQYADKALGANGELNTACEQLRSRFYVG